MVLYKEFCNDFDLEIYVFLKYDLFMSILLVFVIKVWLDEVLDNDFIFELVFKIFILIIFIYELGRDKGSEK